MSVYLDNAATTRLSDSVYSAMLPWFQRLYGNPSSVHSFGRAARDAAEEARENCAKFVGTTPEHIIFTSGGSEANALAIHSMASTDKSHYALTTSGEHPSVINAFIKEGLRTTEIPLNHLGYPRQYYACDFKELDRINGNLFDRRDGYDMCEMMYVNNETGAEFPVKEMGKFAKEKGIPFHVDAVQAAGYRKIEVDEIGCDTLSVSAHKIHGPKGIGFLYVRNPANLTPIIHGEQEWGYRGGTLNVPGIVGLGKAVEYYLDHPEVYVGTPDYSTMFLDALLECGGTGFKHNGGLNKKILSLQIDGVHNATLMEMLDMDGVYVSLGSACHAESDEPSRVLTAMGLSEEEIFHTVRISFSRFTTADEIRKAAEIMVKNINILRELANNG